MPMMEFYAEGARPFGPPGGYYYPPITEAVLIFALTTLSENSERAARAVDEMRAKLTDSEAEVADLRARLQRSELTASALLESLQRSQSASHEGRKRPRQD